MKVIPLLAIVAVLAAWAFLTAARPLLAIVAALAAWAFLTAARP